MLLAIYSLWARDIVRFYRQRSRIVGALGTPLVFWLLLGSGLGTSFRGSAQGATDYLAYFYPGTLALIVLFTSIFSTISVIDDRREGFMQGVLTAPVPRVAIALGKIAGGTTLAVMQAAVFLAVAPLADVQLDWRALPWLGVILTLLAFASTGLGFLIAWWLESTQGFHAIMNLLLVPMWLLSGAVFPASGAAGWIQSIMIANPMTYGVSALRLVLTDEATARDLPALWVSLAVVMGFGAVLAAAGSYSVHAKRIV